MVGGFIDRYTPAFAASVLTGGTYAFEGGIEGGFRKRSSLIVKHASLPHRLASHREHKLLPVICGNCVEMIAWKNCLEK